MDIRVKNSIKYISENLDKPLELTQVARIALVSPYHFHRLFKKEINMSLKEFIQYYKMEKAYTMITNTNLNAREIAIQLGYNNYETFSRAFKRRNKVSPDNLKSIIQKAMGDGSEVVIKKVVVVQMDEPDKAQSESEIRAIITKLTGIEESKNLIMHTKFVIVNTQPAGSVSTNGEQLVKNKYSVKDKSTLWMDIVKKMKSEKLL